MNINRWHRLNYLIPNPLCRMKEDKNRVLQIVEGSWKDERPQPTDEEIDAVAEQVVVDSEVDTLKDSKFNQDIIKAVVLAMKDYLNESRTLLSLPAITTQEVKAKVKSFLL